ncbi:MAG: squalene synthase HpnC [Commensalibacter sp.]|nr:squalene synthase HpnC [Commensalibacter sp.]
MTLNMENSQLYDASIWGEKDVSSGKAAKDENFPVGSLLVSRKLRPHVKIYYDYARVIDDIADSESLTAQEKINRLNGMEAVLRDNVPAPDRSDVMTARFLRNSLIETEVPFETATDLLIAFRQDARKNCYANWDELLDYCRYSANPVGRYLLALHHEGSETYAPSDALCTSLQILNHLQDCKEDLRRLDRCYIPQDMMQAEAVSIEDLSHVKASHGLRRVLDSMLDRVDELNEEARKLPALIGDRRLRLESAVIVKLAHQLTIRLKDEDPIANRVKLTFGDGMAAVRYAFRYFI